MKASGHKRFRSSTKVLQGFDGRLAENFPVSNGHGRRQTGYGTVARQGNLIVSAEESVSYDALKAQLIEEINRQDSLWAHL